MGDGAFPHPNMDSLQQTRPSRERENISHRSREGTGKSSTQVRAGWWGIC